MADLIFYAALIVGVSFLAWFALRWRAGVTEFHVALFAFLLSVWFYLHPLIEDDPHGRTYYSTAGVGIALTVFVAIFALGGIGTLVIGWRSRAGRLELPPAPANLDGRIRMMSIVCAGLCFVSLALAVMRLGTIPLIALSEGDSAGRLIYGDVYGGAEYAIGRGASRAGVILLIVAFFSRTGSRVAFWSTHKVTVVSGAFCLFFAFSDGQRYLSIYPILSALCGAAVLNKFKWKWALPVIIVGFVFIIAVGQFRTRHELRDNNLKVEFGIDSVDTVVRWVVHYHEPNIYNYANLHYLSPEKSWGVVWLGQIIPDAVLFQVVERSPSAPEYLAMNKMYAQPGLTFRTGLGDFYVDFGLVGAAISVVGLCVFGGWLSASAVLSHRRFAWYICYAPAICFLPFISQFGGMPFLIPIVVCALIPETRGMSIPRRFWPGHERHSVNRRFTSGAY